MFYLIISLLFSFHLCLILSIPTSSFFLLISSLSHPPTVQSPFSKPSFLPFLSSLSLFFLNLPFYLFLSLNLIFQSFLCFLSIFSFLSSSHIRNFVSITLTFNFSSFSLSQCFSLLLALSFCTELVSFFLFTFSLFPSSILSNAPPFSPPPPFHIIL